MLSFGIPFALIPLVLIARKKRVMGVVREPAMADSGGQLGRGRIIGLNGFLLVQLFSGG